MAKYVYKARYRHNGELLKGFMEADSKQVVADYLLGKNCLVLSINKAPVVNALFTKQQHRLKGKEVIILCKELAIMLEAGLNMVQAFEILGEGKSRAQQLLHYTTAQLKEGNSLSSIWARENFLPSYLISCIRVAEHTGLLGQAFSQAATYLENVNLRRERLRQITIYPMLLLIMLNIIIAVMLWEIVPTFKEVFKEMDIQLPFLTKILFAISDVAVQMPITGALPLLIIAILLSCRWSFAQSFLLQILRKIPYCYKLMEKLWLVNFGSELLLLYNAGIPLEENLAILQENTKNDYYKQRLKVISQGISQGKSLYTACATAGIKELIFLQLVKVGEETGGLADTLSYSNKFLEQEVDQFLNRLMALLEPGLILIVGLLVGTFIFALIVLLFDIPTAIGV